VSLAEFGSFMLEWHALSARTGNPAYARLADDFIGALARRYPDQVGGLLVAPWANAHILRSFLANVLPGFMLGCMAVHFQCRVNG
jgi:hypothetical protein